MLKSSLTPILLSALCLFPAALAQELEAPLAVKVEPPNWWPGHSINPVRVMIRGRHLEGARVEAVAPGVETGLVRVNAAGTYLFVDLHVSPDAAPGSCPLRIATEGGTVQAPFELLAPLPREGRFQGFGPDDVVYLLMPDRFANGDTANDNPEESAGLLDRSKKRHYHGGDLQGVIDRLPYLKNLGVTALWLNPIYENNDRLNEREVYDEGPITDYHGYGATDFYDVEERLGTLEKFRELVDKAHAMGIKVIQDQVANHTGPYHPWVEDTPTPTWFNGTAQHHMANNWQIWTLADPRATRAVQEPTLSGWFIDILPDLNQDDEETARYLIQNTLWWIGISGLDGIRQDTLPYVPRHFWRDWSAAIRREYPRFSVVGEMWDGNPSLVSFFQGGEARYDGVDSGIEALFDFPLFYAVRGAFTGRSEIRAIPQVISQDRLYVDPNKLLTFVGLHDVPRFMSEPGADFAASKLAHALIFTARGVPVLYYGDEIGMPGGGDPDNRRDFPGGWSEDTRNAFEASGRSPEENDLHDTIRLLARTRAELAPLRRGDMVHLLTEEQTYAFARTLGSETVLVAFNNDTRQRRISVPVREVGLPDGAILQERMGGVSPTAVENGALTFSLPPRSVAIFAPPAYER